MFIYCKNVVTPKVQFLVNYVLYDIKVLDFYTAIIP